MMQEYQKILKFMKYIGTQQIIVTQTSNSNPNYSGIYSFSL